MNYNFLFNESFHKPMLQGQATSIWQDYDQGGGYSEKKMTITGKESDPMLQEVPSLGVAPAVSYITDTHDVIFLEGSENKLIINTEEPHDLYVLYNIAGQSRAIAPKSVLYPVPLKAGRNEIPIADKFLQDPRISEETKGVLPPKYFTVGIWVLNRNYPVIKDGQSTSIEHSNSRDFSEGGMYFFDISENYFNTDLYLTYVYLPK